MQAVSWSETTFLMAVQANAGAAYTSASLTGIKVYRLRAGVRSTCNRGNVKSWILLPEQRRSNIAVCLHVSKTVFKVHNSDRCFTRISTFQIGGFLLLGFCNAIDFRICFTRMCELSCPEDSALHNVDTTDLYSRIVLYDRLWTNWRSDKIFCYIGTWRIPIIYILTKPQESTSSTLCRMLSV